MTASRLRACVFAFVLLLASAASAQETVTLAWDPNPEPDVMGYIIYAGNQPGVYTSSQDNGLNTQRTMTLQPGTYYFVVRAYNAAGLSDPSAEVSVTIAFTPPPPPTWYLFWQHETGLLSRWGMAGFKNVVGTPAGEGRVDPAWVLKATADMNGDGRPDLIFQHQTQGLLAAWLMDGSALLEARLITADRITDLGWQVVAAADFNADGHTDLIFRHRTSGHIIAWIMNGTVLVRGAAVTPSVVSDPNWRLVAAADLNADGRPDLLWQHETNGTLTSWLMNGLTFQSAGLFSTTTLTDMQWKVRGIADVNNDGHPDLVWHHALNGHVAAWICDGARNIVDSKLLIPSPVTGGWRIGGVQ